MSKEVLTYKMLDNISSYLKYELLTKIEDEKVYLPTFNKVLNILSNVNDYTYSYTLKDIDDGLFNNLIKEILKILN